MQIAVLAPEDPGKKGNLYFDLIKLHIQGMQDINDRVAPILNQVDRVPTENILIFLLFDGSCPEICRTIFVELEKL